MRNSRRTQTEQIEILAEGVDDLYLAVEQVANAIRMQSEMLFQRFDMIPVTTILVDETTRMAVLLDCGHAVAIPTARMASTREGTPVTCAECGDLTTVVGLTYG